jgi:hypothetical protein
MSKVEIAIAASEQKILKRLNGPKREDAVKIPLK